MNYKIEKKTLREVPVLFMRRRTEQANIAQTLGELLPAVYRHAVQQGLPISGPPFARYSEMSPGSMTVEAGMPLAAPAAGQDEILAGTLQGGPAAIAIHTGPYDTLHQTHAAIEHWLADHALKAAGAPWESYLTDPSQVPDPAQWKTEVVWPILD